VHIKQALSNISEQEVAVTEESIGVAMNGVTGRMGYHQHLVRSVLAIAAEGGVRIGDGRRVQVIPYLVGRDPVKVADIARRHGITRWTTDLDQVLGDPEVNLYFDAQVTPAREKSVEAAIAAGKHIYCEKPVAETADAALRLARLAASTGVTCGVVHDKLYLPGLLKLRRLIDSGFFGRILSVRGEFGYWVFEGDWQEPQRPSWNYRTEDGGGIVTDMFCHWDYVFASLFGRVRSVIARAVTHVPERWDERGRPYRATADDAAYAIFELDGGVTAQLNSSWCVRVHRDELVEFQVDGVNGSAVAGLWGCRVQHRASTPRAVWNPDLPVPERFRDQWSDVPDNGQPVNGFRAQWEEFIRSLYGEPAHPHDLLSGARGLQLAEAALRSSAEGRRVDLTELSL
jgi:predicted dehydrogenase